MWPFDQNSTHKWFDLSAKQAFAGMVLGFGLIACSVPKPGDRPGETKDAATFFVHKAQVSVTETTLDSQISLPVAKTFNFTVCLKDSARSLDIKNHEFEITGNETQKITSDANGCLLWSESISYNHLAPARWIEAPRKILARGIQKGQRVVLFALNPWESEAHSLMEKARPGLVKAEQASSALAASTSQGIWIDDLRLTVEEKNIGSEGTVLNLEIRANPAFAVVKSNGQKVLEPITKGEFQAELSLIQVYFENQKEKRQLIGKPVQTKGKIAQNALLLQAPITLGSGVRSGQIQLGLKVVPVGGPKSLGAFNGVFNIGEYDQIKGNSFSRLKNDFQEAQGSKTIEQYLTESGGSAHSAAEGPAAGSIATGGGQVANSSAKVRIREITPVNTGFKNQSGMKREKIYSLRLCFMSPIDSKPIRGHSFSVRRSNGTNSSETTNDEGCFTFEDSISFHYLQNECWIQRPVQISNSTLGMNETVSIFVNPWSEGPSSIKDGRQIQASQLTCSKGQGKIVLTRYDFERAHVEYPIDPHMNIKVQKTGVFKLTAKVSRPSSTQASGIDDSPLPPGRYHLRWAIVDHTIKDFSKAAGKIYQAQEKTVTLETGGLISESLTLESDNIRALGNSNTLLLELAPEMSSGTQDSASNTVATYKGVIVLANNVEGSNLEPVQESKDSLLQKILRQFQEDQQKQSNEMQRLAKKETFAQMESLELFNLNNEAQTLPLRRAFANPGATANSMAVPTAELQDWLNTGKIKPETAKRLCGYWFLDRMIRPLPQQQNQPLLTSKMIAQINRTLCDSKMKSSVSTYFDIQYRYFMKNVVKKQDLGGEVKDISFAHGFAMSHSHDEAQTKTASADVNFGISTGKWISPLSAGGGGRLQISYSQTARQASANAVAIQSGESLMLEKLKFQMEASAYEKCALVRLNLESLKGTLMDVRRHFNPKIKASDLQSELQKGILLCDGAVREKKSNWTESYFVLNQKIFNAQVINSNSDLGRPLFMVIRGEKDFRRFMQFLNATLTAPTSAQPILHNAQADDSGMTSVFHMGNPTYPGQYAADN